VESSEQSRTSKVEESLRSSIKYYSGLQKACGSGFRVFSIVQVVLASSIPMATIFLPAGEAARVAAVLGATIAIVKGLDSLYQTRESYVRYAQTAVRSMELEECRLRVGDYETATDPEGLLMLRSIEIRRQENDVWAASTIKPNVSVNVGTSS
jgi:hypothetical protein